MELGDLAIGLFPAGFDAYHQAFLKPKSVVLYSYMTCMDV